MRFFSVSEFSEFAVSVFHPTEIKLNFVGFFDPSFIISKLPVVEEIDIALKYFAEEPLWFHSQLSSPGRISSKVIWRAKSSGQGM